MLYQYDKFIDEDSFVMERVARSNAEGIAKGEIKGQIKTIVQIIKYRFPALEALALMRTQNIQDPGDLDQLIEKISLAEDEKMARAALSLPQNSLQDTPSVL